MDKIKVSIIVPVYNAEKYLYQFVYYFEYYASKSKEYMDIIELENGNYKYIFEYE